MEPIFEQFGSFHDSPISIHLQLQLITPCKVHSWYARYMICIVRYYFTFNYHLQLQQTRRPTSIYHTSTSVCFLGRAVSAFIHRTKLYNMRRLCTKTKRHPAACSTKTRFHKNRYTCAGGRIMCSLQNDDDTYDAKVRYRRPYIIIIFGARRTCNLYAPARDTRAEGLK